MVNNSLYKQYMEEKGFGCVENEFGFMSFIIHDGICMVENFYVLPEFRGSPIAYKLTLKTIEEAKNKGCHTFAAEIYKSDPLFNYILGLHKKFGMTELSNDEFKVVTSKSIKEPVKC